MKEINFSNNNFIKSYQYYAFPLGILASNTISYQNWTLGKFIGITVGKVLQYDEQAYDDWDIIDQTLYKQLDINNFDTFIKNIIDANKVFHIWGVNEKYIPDTLAYAEYDFIHDLLITGYDEYNNLIIVNYGQDRLLSKKLISMDLFKKSFTNETQGRSFHFLPKEINIMEPEIILNNIRQYASPANIYQLKYYDKELNPKREMLVGIPALKEFLNIFQKNFYQFNHLNSLCLLNEHKISIMNSLIYLDKLNKINPNAAKDYNRIVSLSESIKFKYLKSLVSPHKKLQDQIILDISKMINEETLILNNI